MTDSTTPETVWLTQEQLAERWGVTVRYLQLLRKRHQGPKHFVVRRNPLYPMSEVNQYEMDNLTDGTTRKRKSGFPEGAQEKGVLARKNKKPSDQP